MSEDATPDLFKPVRVALLADAALAATVGDRVASDWSTKLDPPFMRMSIPRSLPYEDDCGEGSEVTLRVHVWAKGELECSRLAARVRRVLDAASLDITGHRLRDITYNKTDYLPDASVPKLRMAVAEFTIVTTVAN